SSSAWTSNGPDWVATAFAARWREPTAPAISRAAPTAATATSTIARRRRAGVVATAARARTRPLPARLLREIGPAVTTAAPIFGAAAAIPGYRLSASPASCRQCRGSPGPPTATPGLVVHTLVRSLACELGSAGPHAGRRRPGASAHVPRTGDVNLCARAS